MLENILVSVMENKQTMQNISEDSLIARRTSINKKICMITYLSVPSLIPSLHNEGVYLGKLGFECEAICFLQGTNTLTYEKISEGFSVRRIFIHSRNFFHNVFGVGTESRVKAAIQYIMTYFEYVLKTLILGLKYKADLYEAHDLPTLLPAVVISKIKRKPLVYHAHELYPEMHAKVKFSRFWRFLERSLIGFADEVITPEENRSEIYFKEFPVQNYPITILNCPPYAPSKRTTKLQEYLKSVNIDAKKIVLYQGLLDPSRCVKELVQSANYFNEGIILIIIGGAWVDWQEGITIPKNVILIPRVTYQELAEYTASADIGVLFYRNDCRNNYYCAPNKLHEYMMMGLPVITPNYPGIKKIVEGEKVGLTVDPENINEIAKAVNTLSENLQLFHEMYQNCLRVSYEKFNWENEIQKLIVKYKEILKIDPSIDFNFLKPEYVLQENEHLFNKR
jgi:glycosyltransferase involved in cell wall biosynthesis